MANKNFTDFTLKTPTNADFLVGYNADGSNEFKITINSLVSSYVNNTELNAASSVLLPTSVYRSVSATFATKTDLNAASSVLLPTSIYKEVSGNWQSSYVYVNDNYENWDSVYSQVNELSSSWQGGDLSSYATKTALNAASSVLLPISIYSAASGSFATTTVLNTASSVLLKTSIYQNASGSFVTNTALNAASSVLLPTSVYAATSGNFLVSNTTATPTASSVSNVILISQINYNNLGVKDPNTLYFII